MKCQVALALDVGTRDDARAVLDEIGPSLPWVKIGLQLFVRYGPDFVREVADRGHRIFLDLKLHDIPNTVAGAVESAASLPVRLLTVHASGGPAMLRAALDAQKAAAPDLRLLAVTVLTSMNTRELAAAGIDREPADHVGRLARMASETGIGGFVCSPRETAALRKTLGDDVFLATPGIRLQNDSPDEQQRIAAPADAAHAGADLIVVGRSLLRAEKPAAVLAEIQRQLRS